MPVTRRIPALALLVLVRCTTTQPAPRDTVVIPAASNRTTAKTPDAGDVAPKRYVLADVVEIAVGEGFSCALRKDGVVLCWGDLDRLGFLRPGPRTRNVRPSALGGLPRVTHIAAGARLCALDIEDHVWCWRDDGQPADTREALPALVRMGDARPLEARALSVGASHACVITKLGATMCWGDGADGKLGVPWQRTGAASPSPIPTQVKVPQAKSLAVGLNNTCVVTEASELYCWGGNDLGELGSRPASRCPCWTHVPQLVRLDALLMKASAGDAVCALDVRNRVQCWGSNDFGQAGDAANVGPSKPLSARPRGMTGVFAPHVVPGLNGATDVAAGGTFACAVRADHTVACFGNASEGGLGHAPDDDPHATPETIPGITDAIQVSVGDYQACALRRGGTVMCWGKNFSGELGRGTTTTNDPTPVEVFAP